MAVDCCGFCPEPVSDEESQVQGQEDVMPVYVCGDLKFLRDDPRTQEIGSLNLLSPEFIWEEVWERRDTDIATIGEMVYNETKMMVKRRGS